MRLRPDDIQTNRMTEPIELYRWRYRDELTGKIVTTRYVCTRAETRERYGAY
jgi:hypothetical protein